MIFFISVLRALAAIVITNSHYTGVYPSDIIANGGLWGDVIFFAVSGFCLIYVKQNFGKWYLKRILRCYVAVIFITAIYMLFGFYSNTDGLKGIVSWFIYPTNYHFVASIIVLYIPFYFIGKTEKFRKNIPWIMLGVFFVFLIYYIFAYDKSYYHIDKVREPVVRILFFEAMLLGAYFKVNKEKFINKNKLINWILLAGFLIIYFVTKLVFSKISYISNFQITNQIVLFLLLYFTFRCFCGVDNSLEKMPKKIKSIINYLSEITLEIYVVQYAIIPRLATVAPFPLNWILITSTILISASALHFIVKFVNSQTDKLFVKR